MRAQALAIPITVPVRSSCSNTTNIPFYSHYVTALFTATVLLLLQLLLSLLLVLDLLWLCDSFYKNRGNKISDSRWYCSIYWRRHKSNSADVYATAVAVAVTVTVTVPTKRFHSHYASAAWQLPLVLYTAITAAFFVLVHPTAKNWTSVSWYKQMMATGRSPTCWQLPMSETGVQQTSKYCH